MNHSSFPLGSQKIREAIRYAINVDQIATQVYLNMVSRTDTPIIGRTWLYSDTPGAYGYDLEKAKTLLAEEGWKDLNDDGTLDKPVEAGKEPKHLVLGLHVYEDTDNGVRVAAAYMIKDMLAQVGISVHVEQGSFADVSTALSAGSFDLALVSYQMDAVPDPGFMLTSGNTGNYSRYKSTEMNDLIKTLRAQENPEDFAKTLSDIQQLFAREVPFICLFYRNGSVLTHKMYTTARDVRELELLRGIESFAH
jgi:peptide/nickel transport system substrate-binding protein